MYNLSRGHAHVSTLKKSKSQEQNINALLPLPFGPPNDLKHEKDRSFTISACLIGNHREAMIEASRVCVCVLQR